MSCRTRWSAVFTLAPWLLFGCSAVHGEVVHPQPGEKNTVEECAKGNSQEQNCSRCTSKPGCGFCATPAAGASSCQPGITGDDTPSTCSGALVISSDACEVPPPPVGE
jgi:hypothetical protein